MPHAYAVLGAGLQGLAAAYDLARFGDASRIVVADTSQKAAEAAANRANALSGTSLCEPEVADAMDEASLRGILAEVEVCLSCVPYYLHPLVARAGMEAGASVVDMGGDTEDALKTLALDAEAKRAGVSIVTDSGLAPGLANALAAMLIERFDEPQEARLYCGGLPLSPRPPLNYSLAFSVEGLISEYADKAFGVRDGQVVELESLEDLESLEWPELGPMEAFTTSGGAGTAPWTFEGKLRTYEYKTVRFPGHCRAMRLFRDIGFWSQERVEVEGAPVRPRALFEKLATEFLLDPDPRDQVLLRVAVSGVLGGKRRTLAAESRETFDERTGLTAMQRMTGFPTSICAIAIAKRQVPRGCHAFEQAMDGAKLLEDLASRGIAVNVA